MYEDSGFSIQAADQIAYNKALADLAHSYGLGIGLKNEAEQVADRCGGDGVVGAKLRRRGQQERGGPRPLGEVCGFGGVEDARQV